MTARKADFPRLLRTLNRHGVDFLVVGGVAAVLQGAPLSTFDWDVVHRRDPENIERLLTALGALRARYRTLRTRVLKPQHSHLMSSGHQLLSTRYGPLDLWGEIGARRGSSELVKESTTISIGRGFRVRVLGLDALIRIKGKTARDKDRAMLAILPRTFEESQKEKRPPRRSR